MKRLLFSTGFVVFLSLSRAQVPVGTWTDHLVYSSAKNLAASSEAVYASTGSAILVYYTNYDELRKLSRVNGLTEAGINAIAWSEENKTLIIAYSSSNIDLVSDNVIYNIPDIYRKYMPGRKDINRIRINGRYAMLACSFGIVLIDLIKKEVYDTWKPGINSEATEVWDIAISNGKVYAATSIGIFTADVTNQGLAFYGNWSRFLNVPGKTGRFTAIVAGDNKVYVNKSPLKSTCDTIYAIGTTTSVFTFTPGITNRTFENTASGFSVSSGSIARFYSKAGILQKTISSYRWGSPDISQAIETGGYIWLADTKYGLLKGTASSDLAIQKIDGPVSNNAISISALDGKKIICGGGLDASWNNMGRPFEVSSFENNTWSIISYPLAIDALRSIIDPDDNSHFFISTWGWGLLEFQNNTIKNRYYEGNSPLQTIVPNGHYVRVCGMAYDKYKNLWITQTEVPGSLKALKPDGTWIVNPATVSVPSIGDLMITGSGKKWVVLPRGNGLFILDDNDTPEIFTDDKSKQFLVTDSENNIISMVNCLAEDQEGNVWVGTDQGPLVYYNPDKVINEDIKAYRLKVARNDGTNLADYMLKSESITSIAIDGANRKWIGTTGSGAYLLSPDGTRKILNYNESNSPILSNTITSIAIDNKSGEVWFGTSRGVISIRGDANEGSDNFSDAYAFPNPVREDYTGNVTITGLMKDSHIRIADISGNLVYRTMSEGGMATWDLTTYNGKRVTTGVYLVFCSNSDGSGTRVIKLLVISQ